MPTELPKEAIYPGHLHKVSNLFESRVFICFGISFWVCIPFQRTIFRLAGLLRGLRLGELLREAVVLLTTLYGFFLGVAIFNYTASFFWSDKSGLHLK